MRTPVLRATTNVLGAIWGAMMLVVVWRLPSVPVGLLIAKTIYGIDLRTTGSGNIGATNVGRTLGKRWGIACLLLDASKGVAATLLPLLATWPTGWLHGVMVACGAAAVLGHVFPVWLRFRGGKGVATGAGVAAVLAWQAALAAALAFAVVFLLRRIVSLSSIIAAVVYAAVVVVMFEVRSPSN